MYRCGLRLWIMGLVVCVVLGGCAQLAHYGPVRVEDYTETIRVACVGDSITYGSGIKDRDTNSYPAQLGVMLGDAWDVGNFGVSGATMLKKSNKPYWRQKAFTALGDKESLFPDKIYPNAEGAGLMAGEVRRALTGE